MKAGIDELNRLETVIGYSFSDRTLLTEALSHSSYVNELRVKRTACYERLEYLGDSILEFISSEFLFDKFPNATEGELSKHRAALVCEKALSACARKIELGRYILLGRGEERNNGADKDSILCDVIEAVIGAIYKDGGLEPAERFIMEHILAGDDTSHYTDYKTTLQEIVQTDPEAKLAYEIIEVAGAEHDKQFSVRVTVNGEEVGRGSGNSKKEAEQCAASDALSRIQGKG